MSKKVQSQIENWDVFDERLPEKLICVPPDDTFIASFEERQYQPIAVNLWEEEYTLIFGNRRLYAGRAIANQDGRRTIEVRVFAVPPEDIPTIQAQENSLRSDNEISDFMILKELLGSTETDEEGNLYALTYKDCASRMGRSVGYLKKLDNQWSSIPKGKKNDWILEAVLNGTMTQTTAKKLGKLSDEQLKVTKEEHKESGKLTGKFVNDLRNITRSSITQNVMEKLEKSFTPKKQFFTRQEVQSIFDRFNNGEEMETIRKEVMES